MSALLTVHAVLFYRAMHVVLAPYCYRKSSVRPSIHPSVRLSICDVVVPWANVLG